LRTSRGRREYRRGQRALSWPQRGARSARRSLRGLFAPLCGKSSLFPLGGTRPPPRPRPSSSGVGGWSHGSGSSRLGGLARG
jgi:hypothetical protein